MTDRLTIGGDDGVPVERSGGGLLGKLFGR